MIEAILEQRSESGRNHRLAAKLPHPVDFGECAGIDGALDHMAQEQRVAARRVPHDVGGQALQRPAENRFDERDALLLGERHQLKTLEVVVLPQRGDGIGNRFATANGCHDLSGPLNGDLMYQGRRQLVE